MFVDTAGWLIALDASGPRHEQAKAYLDLAATRITHNYVIAELVALAEARGFPRGRVLAFVAALRTSPAVEVVWVDRPLHAAALELLSTRLDKTYSLCDAVSFIVMTERGNGEALTTDRHFEQAGFRRLLT